MYQLADTDHLVFSPQPLTTKAQSLKRGIEPSTLPESAQLIRITC